jgi:hypothetical protein
MAGRPGIIAFAKDWHEDPTSNHHVLIELARSRPVLWLNSVATRTPKLTSGRDLGKIKRKLGEFARGPVQVMDNLWVFSPLVLPLPHNPVAQRINQSILRATIAVVRRRLGLRDFDLWTFLPNTADYVGTLGERASVYYCVDEWSLFSYLDERATRAAEARLLAKVDACFAINHALADAKRAQQPATTSRRTASITRCSPRPRRRHRAAGRRRQAAAADHRLLRHAPGLGRLRADRGPGSAPPWLVVRAAGPGAGRRQRGQGPAQRPPARAQAPRPSCRRTARASTSASSRTASTSA